MLFLLFLMGVITLMTGNMAPDIAKARERPEYTILIICYIFEHFNKSEDNFTHVTTRTFTN